MMDLSVGETLTILRRRNSLTQEQIAKKYFVSQMTVSMWESDSVPFPGLVNPIYDLHPGEECYVLRRRLHMNIRQVAKELDVSHVTVIKWEKKGPPDSRYRNLLLELSAKQEAGEMA